ncbi:sugar phosphorylase [uncultured Georgenia sp.]|uniref:sugar phosphorylase n=1 Tax=uncultured Georgenia sp. TaxID=378209 RepID=UPI00260B7654|nr:sugar phosphorylase [uncultured Georgenia sp.]
MLSETAEARLLEHLTVLYGPEAAPDLLAELRDVVARALPTRRPPRERFAETDVFVIAYGDHVTEPGRVPLQTLGELLTEVAPEVTGLHLLPHYPATSDGGFAVADHLAVDPALGTWADVEALGRRFRLMLDAVLNHTSASHPWFRGFLDGDPQYADFYVTADPEADAAALARVTRPRTTPLLTRFTGAAGERWVWTTFSADQVDLDFRTPAVLVAATEVLLRYIAHGATWIRLDAIAFLWKTLGTTCMHLPQTHEVVRLWRTLVDDVAPGTVLLTETNVPHEENISYLAEGQEAHAVYQFALPPLTLAAFHRRDASVLTGWLRDLARPPEGTTFFTFLASHDGIGLRPLEGLVAPEEVARLAETVADHGGLVSWRTTPDGGRAPYEINSVYYDALRPPGTQEDEQVDVARFLAAHAILLALPGVPALYLHSLLGSRSWHEGVERSGHARDINRERLDLHRLTWELADAGGRRARVLEGLREMIAVRVAETAFHPDAPMTVLDVPAGQLAVLRSPREGTGGTVLCVQDVAGAGGTVRAAVPLPDGTRLHDLLGAGGRGAVVRDGAVELSLAPYGVRWLRVE